MTCQNVMKIGAKNGHATRQKSQKKNKKWTLQKLFFLSKIPHDFKLLKQVPESSYQTIFCPEPMYCDINFVLKCLPVNCRSGRLAPFKKRISFE